MKRKNFKLEGILAYYIVAALLTSVCLGVNAPAYAAEADFQTDEYKASNGLELINAATAYNKGYSGKGITLGVCDSPTNFAHPEFSSKNLARMIRDSWMVGGKPGVYDWDVLRHGTHVAGIVGASKNGISMHGVAYNADLVGVPAGYDLTESGSTDFSDPFAPFYARDNVKGINNSWTDPVYFDEVLSGSVPEMLNNANSLDDFSEKFMAYLAEFDTSHSKQVAALGDATARGKLLVFAAGNAGHPTPSIQSMSGWFYDATQTNLINVTALNNNFDNYSNGIFYRNGMTRQADGTISGKWLMTFFSDGAKYAEEYTLAAPGSNILSTNANFAAEPVKYIYDSGTSMAAPFVTGVAGLVQEAFPYMSGKEIADTLLSTANNNIVLNKGYFVTRQNDSGKINYNVFYFDGNPRTTEQIQSDINGYYADDLPYRYNQPDYAPIAYYNVPLQAFIGQGVIDAGKAVNGPGALNARRLATTDVTKAYSNDGGSTVMYPIDTKGYDSTWSNDIKEIKVGKIAADSTEADLRERYNYYNTNWNLSNSAATGAALLTQLYVKAYNTNVENGGMEGLHVGLIKSGAGRLSLTGNNTYAGASVAKGGILSIDGSVAGDAYSVDNGTIAGRGTIGGTLYNRNIAVAGDDAGTGNLTMKNLVSTGTLVSHVTVGESPRFIVQETADITDSKVLLNNVLPGESREVLTAGTVQGHAANSADKPQATTGMLSTYAQTVGNTLTATAIAANNLGNVDGQQSENYQAMNHMYQNLPDARREEMRTLYNLAPGSAKEALTDIGSSRAGETLSVVQTNTLVSHVISDRLNTAFSMEPVNVRIRGNNLADGGRDNGIDVPVKLPVATENGAWVKFTKNWGGLKGGAHYHGSAISGGYDKAFGKNTRGGLFVAYNTMNLGKDSSAANIYDTRIGIYGGYHKGARDAYWYADYGWQRNNLRRGLSNLGIAATADYCSYIAEIGGEYKYDLHAEDGKIWHVSPYVNRQLSYMRQDGYNEQGAGVFNQQVAAKNNTYFALGMGVEWKRYLGVGSYAMRLGIKHALSGADPHLKFNYEGDNGHSYTLNNSQDKTHVIMGISGETEFTKGWQAGGDIMLQKGAHDKDLTASIMLRRVW
ncbi:S8 family serine peptidase [Selenomonas ruminantium]|uniref:Autotransporter-associated beta strand repeat-containing protein n=1 Tax=Selenomonas ruminantium TaxID=971 RepID=A0A1H3Y5J5_SELRU|nr:S8 family serine peptidase [Selenomonas ruminantium]SEA06956.1 autotransporter-associated beta strand repeat-containing protein [Selenomonas ruminantium]